MATQPRPQPFKYHPMPGSFFLRTLGADSKLFTSVNQDSGDVLFVPPTPVSANGHTERLISDNLIRVTEQPQSEGPTPLNPGDIKLVLKTVDGREAVLFQNTGGEDVGQLLEAQSATLLLNAATDLGLFLRITAPDVAVDACSQYQDVRGCTPVAVDIVDVFPEKTLVLANSEFGRTQAPGASGSQGSFGPREFQNFDSVQHGIRLFVSDGENEFELNLTPSYNDTPAGFLQTASVAGICPLLPQGWSLYAALTEPVVTKSPRLVVGVQATNATARSDQAGAY
jgi:hypothetical protein